MAHNGTAGRARSSKKIGAVLGMAAAGLMIVLPPAINGWHATSHGTSGSGPYSVFTLPPTMSEGATLTTTTPPTAPAVMKAAPEVKAPHK